MEHGGLSVQIAMEIADREGVDPADLSPPLYDVIDTEALEALFKPTRSTQRDVSGSVSFEYNGYRVTVDADETVEITTPTRQQSTGKQLGQFQR